ncbi:MULTISPECIES: GNAT family N-acetyltransferase [Haloferax]|uniref:GNAT family N-acetyltransferase n=1 Tax=Haloferax marinum TaxID=2666143 RepID=A0A6A8G8J2_9EURY|nr:MULTISPECIES: N-acetyltransferase [Haloferax]KAB1198298.1 N-acetyltransferase [Haloferax sp. CBA1150]MRW97394.1 GNAT family N-acetyltransferase [Haloferax marinum]
MVLISPETPAEESAVESVHAAAFPTDDEAKLVAALRQTDAFVPSLSLVARDGDDVVGHVLCTRVSLEADPSVRALTLAPVGVLPDEQGQGIGSSLVQTALDTAADEGFDLVFLHGDPDFYSQFGFHPAGIRGFENPFETPPEVFMVAVVGENAGEGGALSYPAPFDDI